MASTRNAARLRKVATSVAGAGSAAFLLPAMAALKRRALSRSERRRRARE
jgi:hypothetical protein